MSLEATDIYFKAKKINFQKNFEFWESDIEQNYSQNNSKPGFYYDFVFQSSYIRFDRKVK